MKKIISLLATVAMISTLFVSVVKADFQPTVTTEKETLNNDDFKALTRKDIPDGYDAFLLTIGFSNLGDLNCELSVFGEHSGRKLQGFGYSMTFDSLEHVNTTWTRTMTSKFNGVNLSKGFDGNTYNVIFNAGSAGDAYPNEEANISNASISEVLKFLVVVEKGETVTATLNTNMNIVTYSDDVYGEEEATNFATMTPASVQFAAAAPVDPTPTPVYTDSSIDVKKPVNGTTGLTDLQGKDVTLTANYGIAKFSKAIDTAANDYFVVATDSNDVEKVFDVDFGAKGVEISNASTTFFAIVKSADHIIKNIRLKEVAKKEAD